MRRITNTERKRRQTLRTAQISSVLFGVGLLTWGLAPAVVQRISTGHPPLLEMLAVRSLTLLLGVGLVVLGVLIGRGVGWALWVALLVSLGLLAGALSIAALWGATTPGLFPLLLALSTAATSGLALDARRLHQRSQPSAPAA